MVAADERAWFRRVLPAPVPPAQPRGFPDGDPWLPVNPNFQAVNVEDARADPDSVWHYYRDLVALRPYEARVYRPG